MLLDNPFKAPMFRLDDAPLITSFTINNRVRDFRDMVESGTISNVRDEWTDGEYIVPAYTNWIVSNFKQVFKRVVEWRFIVIAKTSLLRTKKN